jgi:predicted negative regulator of RcsB-dependent stress response
LEEHLDIEEGQRLAAAKAFAYRHRFLLATIAIAALIGAAAGWGYNRYLHSQRLSASDHYQQAMAALAEGRRGEARQAFQTLVTEFDGTNYAGLARVMRARLLHADGDRQGALDLLEPLVTGKRGPTEARHVAVEAAARIRWDGGDPKAALATLEEIAPSAYLPSYFQLRGDLLVADDRPEAARNAYQRALEKAGSGPLKAGLEARLDQLPAAGGEDGQS